jgi:HEPN domain-containing protein
LSLATRYDKKMPMSDRSKDWLAQAEKDLDQAKSSQAEGRHEWACFAAQQSAEKAVKALHLLRGQEAWGHVVAKLLEELALEIPETLIDKAKVLDNLAIPTRYANGHPDGAPFEHYGKLQSEDAICYASEILEFVRNKMA